MRLVVNVCANAHHGHRHAGRCHCNSFAPTPPCGRSHVTDHNRLGLALLRQTLHQTGGKVVEITFWHLERSLSPESSLDIFPYYLFYVFDVSRTQRFKRVSLFSQIILKYIHFLSARTLFLSLFTAMEILLNLLHGIMVAGLQRSLAGVEHMAHLRVFHLVVVAQGEDRALHVGQ